MKVYFLSAVPAILKLNGQYAGRVDGFEREADVAADGTVMAELVPDKNLQPVNFFISYKLFLSPPPFMDVYLGEHEAFLYVRRYPSRDMRLNVILQTKFSGNLVTLFSQGDVYLSVEGAGYDITPVGESFSSASAEQKIIGGHPVLAITGGDRLIVLSRAGRQIFCNAVTFAQFGQTFKAGVKFETCAAAEAVCEYSYDGEELTLISSVSRETEKPLPEVLHFAFFESVMTYCGFLEYLSPSLQPSADKIRGYLGEYRGVITPPASFCARRPGVLAAGLLYPKAENLFEIKYFAVDVKDGKIENVYPAE